MFKQRIRALERKFARQLAEIEAHNAAIEYVRDCDDAQEEGRLFPNPYEFCDRLNRAAGYFRLTTDRVCGYIVECLGNGIVPDGNAIFIRLLPYSRYD